MTEFNLHTLQDIIAQRAGVRDGSSYTAQLVQKGMAKASKKLGEEAVETVIAAMGEGREALINESADLLYHLLVVWHMEGIEVDDVMATLQQRTRQSGLEEKAARLK